MVKSNFLFTARGTVQRDTKEAEQFNLPHPNLAVEDGYSGGGEKISVAGVSMASKRSRHLSASSSASMEASDDARVVWRQWRQM